jgi:hypothetical protein
VFIAVVNAVWTDARLFTELVCNVVFHTSPAEKVPLRVCW